jgi:transposase
MPVAEKYIVRLSATERQAMEDWVLKGQRSVTIRTRARILLQADATGEPDSGDSDEAVAEAVEASVSTVHRVRQAYVEDGLAAALERKKPTGRQYRKLDGAQEARLIAVACGAPPTGRARWTLQLLADRLVELKVVESVSPECVRTTLKKTT